MADAGRGPKILEVDGGKPKLEDYGGDAKRGIGDESVPGEADGGKPEFVDHGGDIQEVIGNESVSDKVDGGRPNLADHGTGG